MSEPPNRRVLSAVEARSLNVRQPLDMSIILCGCERLARELPSFEGRDRGLPSFEGRDRGLPSFQGRDRGLPSFQGRDRGLPSFEGRDRGLPSFEGRDRDGRTKKITIP